MLPVPQFDNKVGVEHLIYKSRVHGLDACVCSKLVQIAGYTCSPRLPAQHHFWPVFTWRNNVRSDAPRAKNAVQLASYV